MKPTRKINRMTPAAIRILSRDIEQSLQILGERHGVRITAGTARVISHRAAGLWLDMVIGTEGEIDHAQLFVTHAKSLGLRPTDLNTTVIGMNKKSYTIVGLRSKDSRDVILTDQSNGTTHEMPADLVALCKRLRRRPEES